MYIWLETTFGTVQKWSLRPLLDSLKGGLNIEILLYAKMISGDITRIRIMQKMNRIYTDLHPTDIDITKLLQTSLP